MGASRDEVAGLLAKLLDLLKSESSHRSIMRLEEVIGELQSQPETWHSARDHLFAGAHNTIASPNLSQLQKLEIEDENEATMKDVVPVRTSSSGEPSSMGQGVNVHCSPSSELVMPPTPASVDTTFMPQTIRELRCAKKYRDKGSESSRTRFQEETRRTSWDVHITESGFPTIVTRDDANCVGVRDLVIRAVNKPEFDMFWMSVIVLNALALGVQIEYHARSGVSHWSTMPLHAFFFVLFAIELLMRLVGLGFRKYLRGPGWAWAWFDICIVGLSAIDLAVDFLGLESQTSSHSFQVMRLMRVFRVARVVRGIRFMRDLRLLIGGMINSVMAISWTLFALIFLMYVGAIVVMTVVVDSINSGEEYYVRSWGCLISSMCTLFQVMSGDAWWTEVVAGIRNDYPGIEFLFITYYASTAYGLLNIVTGIFVDQTLRVSQNDAELLREKQVESTTALRAFLTDIFKIMDANESGRVSYQEFEQSLADPRVKFAFQYIDLKPDDVLALFMLFDKSLDGAVDVDEFLDGCMTLKGQPTVAELVKQGRRTTDMLEKMYQLMRKLERGTRLAL